MLAVRAPGQAAEAEPLAEARRAVDAGHLSAAEALLRVVLRAGPGTQPAPPVTAEAHYLLGYVLFREQRATDSLAEYTAGAALQAPTAQELEVVASDYVLLKDYADAEHWLRYATARAPAELRAWYLLGRTEYNLDRDQEAADAFQRCLQLAPRDIRCEYNLGLAFERLQQPEQAEAAYHTAIAWQAATPTQDPQPYLDLGLLERKQGRTADAIAHLRTAATLAPRNPLAWEQLGLALDTAGQTSEAILALQQAATSAPEAQQPHFFLGRIYRRLGRADDAAAQFRIVEKLAGTHSDTSTPNPDQSP